MLSGQIMILMKLQEKDTSVNYLAANVLKAAGVPTNDYQSFLLKLQEEYPIISAVRTDKTADKTLDKASNKSDKATGSKKKQADSDMLNDYKLFAILQTV